MKVLNYEAHNVLRVSDVSLNLEGRHLFLIGGKNGQGKTSTLTALLMALCGRSGMDYPEIGLKAGEDKGWVKVSLSGDPELHEPSGLTIELFLRRKRGGEVVEEFRVLDSSGEEAPEPRTLLKRLCALRGFDPLAFERLDKKAKRATLMKVLGLDFSEQKAEFTEKYAERTRLGREGKEAKAKLDAMPHYPDAPTAEVSTEDLVAEMERRQQVNEANAEVRKGSTDAERDYAFTLQDVEDKKRKLREAQVALETAEAKLAGVGKLRSELAANCAALVDASVDEVRQQISQSGSVNAKVRANADRAAASAKLATKRAAYDLIQKRLDEIEAEQAKALREAAWPVPGLTIDNEGVLYNDLPIEQASRSLRITTSVKIGMALNPKLRLLVCEHGGDMDTETLLALDKLLAVSDFQMLMELVTRTDADEDLCAVIISDGQVKQSDIDDGLET